mgnify:CR=1 FL=1
MKIRAIMVAAIISIFPLSTFAQGAPSDPMVSYAAYNTAIEAGNLADAATHAMAAWRAAETTWGASNPNTGGLAYNAAWSAMLVGKPDVAVEPARRAVEMGAVPNAPYAIDEANFLLAYAEFQIATPEQRERLVRRFVQKIEKVEASWGDFLIVNALNSASNSMLGTESPREARELANKALAQITRLEMASPMAKATAFFNRGRAQMYLRNHQEAVSDLIDARIAYGREHDHEDKTWGQLAAWHSAAIALAQSDNFMPRIPTGSNITRGRTAHGELRELTTEEWRSVERPWPAICRGIEFERDETQGRNIQFPAASQMIGLVAGVLARLQFSADGRVEKIDILGVVPNESFSENAKEAIATWRYNFPQNTPTECRSGYLLRVHFVYER